MIMKPKRSTKVVSLRVSNMQLLLIDKRCRELGINRNTFIKQLVFKDLLGAGVYSNQKDA